MEIVSSCGFELSPKRLPNYHQQRKCRREKWSDHDGRCILHTTAKVENVERLESEIRDANRIDGLQLGGKKLSEGFSFEEMQVYGGDFQNSDIRRCNFVGSDVMYSRFEGANLGHTTFTRDVQSSEDQEDPIVNSRVKIRYNNFEDAELSDATFEKASLLGTRFNCENMVSADFVDCSLPGLSFSNQDFSDSDFSYSLFNDTSFNDCGFYNSTFHASVLKEVDFSGCDFRKADLRNALFDETDFSNVQVDHRTQLDDLIVQEYLADRYREERLSANEVDDVREFLHYRRKQVPISFSGEISSRRRLEELCYGVKRYGSRVFGSKSSLDYSLLEHARYRYRDFSRIFSENDEPDKARSYTIREKHTNRKNALNSYDAGWFWLSFSRWTMRYGEEPVQPIKTAVGVITASALIYPVFGISKIESGNIISYCLSCTASVDSVSSVIRLSIVRFLSTNNPGIQPLGIGIAIGLFESIMGALLIAMFVFTLGRRATE